MARLDQPGSGVVQQRREQVVVVAIDQEHLGVRLGGAAAGQLDSARQPGEASAEDYRPPAWHLSIAPERALLGQAHPARRGAAPAVHRQSGRGAQPGENQRLPSRRTRRPPAIRVRAHPLSSSPWYSSSGVAGGRCTVRPLGRPARDGLPTPAGRTRRPARLLGRRAAGPHGPPRAAAGVGRAARDRAPRWPVAPLVPLLVGAPWPPRAVAAAPAAQPRQGHVARRLGRECRGALRGRRGAGRRLPRVGRGAGGRRGPRGAGVARAPPRGTALWYGPARPRVSGRLLAARRAAAGRVRARPARGDWAGVGRRLGAGGARRGAYAPAAGHRMAVGREPLRRTPGGRPPGRAGDASGHVLPVGGARRRAAAAPGSYGREGGRGRPPGASAPPMNEPAIAAGTRRSGWPSRSASMAPANAPSTAPRMPCQPPTAGRSFLGAGAVAVARRRPAVLARHYRAPAGHWRGARARRAVPRWLSPPGGRGWGRHGRATPCSSSSSPRRLRRRRRRARS